MSTTEPVSPADTIRRALVDNGDSAFVSLRVKDVGALLAVGERDKAEIEALSAAVEGLLDVGTRSRRGDPSLDPEEWYAIRDYAQKALKDGSGAALREARERDRRQIARLTEILRDPASVPQWGVDDYRYAIRRARAVLAGEEDAPRARTVVGFAECGDAVDLAEGFAAFWHHDTTSDRLALAEWLRQLHDEVGKVLYGRAAGEEDAGNG